MSEARPMRKYFMVLSKQMYEEVGEGLVRVTGQDGRTGLFRCDGNWVEGDIREANLHMLMYVGGPTLPAQFNYRWPDGPVDPQRASGWPEAFEEPLRELGVLKG